MDPSRERFPGVGVPAGAVLLGVVALIAVGAIVALTVGRIGSGGDERSISGRSVGARFPTTITGSAEPSAVAPTSSAAPERSPTPEAVRLVLRSYTRSYEAEDAEAVVATMSLSVIRRSGAISMQRGREKAMIEYQRQFDQLVHPRYMLGRLSIATGATEARAHGRYTITSDDAARSTGSITFHLVYVDNRLLIDRITAVPD